LRADALLMLTDVEAIFTDWGGPAQRAITDITPDAIEKLAFQAGSMAPKVASACDFIRAGGAMAGVGRLSDASAILEGRAGSRITASGMRSPPIGD
jgi:carbamate kinase